MFTLDTRIAMVLVPVDLLEAGTEHQELFNVASWKHGQLTGPP